MKFKDLVKESVCINEAPFDLHKSQQLMKAVFAGIRIQKGLKIDNKHNGIKVTIGDIRCSNLLSSTPKIEIEVITTAPVHHKEWMDSDDFYDYMVEGP